MQSIIMSLRSIRSNKMRTVLTMLGIIIGVMALVVLVSLINGTTNSVTSAVSDLGSSMITVSVSDDKGSPITLDTLRTWQEEEPELGDMAPYQVDTLVGQRGGESGSVTVYGTTPAYYEIQGMQLAMGRFLKQTDVDNESYVCVLNETAAEELVGYIDCVGQTITLDNVTLTVVGILEDDEDSLISILASGTYIAYSPYTTLVRVSDTAAR